MYRLGQLTHLLGSEHDDVGCGPSRGLRSDAWVSSEHLHRHGVVEHLPQHCEPAAYRPRWRTGGDHLGHPHLHVLRSEAGQRRAPEPGQDVTVQLVVVASPH
jgi:hypothetical protein